MKRTLNLFYAAALVLMAGFISSCDKDEDPPPNTDVIYNINATLSGANEVPANASTATGTATGKYNATSRLLTYTVNWTGLTGPATAGHFHSPALPGVNASPLVFFLLQNNGNAGTTSGSATLSAAQGQDLIDGKFYANIHTAANSGGEIRGQVAATQ
jgi:hypothetical protein